MTGYLFLSFGHIQAGAFALGQGLLIDVFSVGPNGLSALVYVSVFWGIYLGSLFFNFHTVKGQIIIISLIVFFKHAMWQAVTGFFLDNTFISISFLCATAVSVVGTGLLTPVLYGIFDRLRGVPGGEEESPDVEELNNPLWENNR